MEETMDKEAREAIENEIHEWLFGAKIVDSLALRILSLLKQLGYCKVPELKVLSDEEINEVVGEITGCYYIKRNVPDTEKAIAQAQLDSIKGQIDEANK